MHELQEFCGKNPALLQDGAGRVGPIWPRYETRWAASQIDALIMRVGIGVRSSRSTTSVGEDR
jgi:hypothetical protein